jgi:hypothetical protein
MQNPKLQRINVVFLPGIIPAGSDHAMQKGFMKKYFTCCNLPPGFFLVIPAVRPDRRGPGSGRDRQSGV